ncbi:MAG: hypothetical protein WCE79_19600 [Xanthobacteraceae bacterium]
MRDRPGEGWLEHAARLPTARRRKPIPNNLAAIEAALEAAGIEFTNGDVPGVRLRKKRR